MKKYLTIIVGLFISAVISAQTISGPSYICSGSATFSASSLPSGYYWGKSSNLNLSSTTTNPVTVTLNGSGSGWVALYNGISPNAVTTHYVWIGGPEITISGPSSVDVGQPGSSPGNTFWASASNNYSGPPILEYQWILSPSYAGTLYDYGYYANVYFYPAGSSRLEVRARNTGGWGPWEFHYVDASRQTATAAYKVYPNPVRDILYIDIDLQQSLSNANSQLTYDIRLYDTQGNLAHNTVTAQTGTVQIDVSQLRNGTYLLQIFDGVDPQPYAQVIIKQ